MVPLVLVVAVALLVILVPLLVLDGTVPLMVMVLDVPAAMVPRLKLSWVTFCSMVGISSIICTFCASEGPLLVMVMV